MKYFKRSLFSALLLAAAAGLVLGWILFRHSIGSGEAGKECSAESGEQTQLLECRSAADYAGINTRVTYPPSYATMERRPLILAFPGAPQMQGIRPIQCILAEVADRRGNETMTKWLLDQDCLGILESLTANLPVDEQRIFFVANGTREVEFLCRQAPRFAGAVIAMPDASSDEWQHLPLENLTQIPVYVDTTVNMRPPVQARRLAQRLRELGGRVTAPETLVEDGIPALAKATPWLMENQVRTDLIRWSWDGSVTAKPWWLTVTARENPSQPARITAEIIPGGRPLVEITAENLTAFSIRRPTSPEKPLFVNINGARLMLPHIRPGEDLQQHLEFKDGRWQRTAAPGKAQDGELWTVGGLLKRPFVIVTGTADENTAEAWRQCGATFAWQWQQLTGTQPMLLSDREFLQNTPEDRVPIFFGSPEENHAATAMLAGIQPQLRDLYRTIHDSIPDTREICSISVHASRINAGTDQVIMLIADSPEAVPHSWLPLCKPDKLMHNAVFFHYSEPDKIICPEGK